jgi:hypothetical protein
MICKSFTDSHSFYTSASEVLKNTWYTLIKLYPSEHDNFRYCRLIFIDIYNILLGTGVPLRFSKHPPYIYSIFLKTIPIHIYFRWKSWPNHIFHNSVNNVIIYHLLI